MRPLFFLPLTFVLPLAGTDAGGRNPAAPSGCDLTITCPDDAKLVCGGSIDPNDLGSATAQGTCPPITITYHDNVTMPPCPANRFEDNITRVWTATDAGGNTATCSQTIHVVKQTWFFDFHPRSCPNPLNIGGNGVVPAAILGTATLDVSTIDPTTVQIWTENCADGPVSPTMITYEDVAAPYTGGVPCGCTTAGPDGRVDLNLKFNKQQLVQGLHLGNYPSGTFVKLVITARTAGGCGIVGSDCVRVQ